MKTIFRQVACFLKISYTLKKRWREPDLKYSWIFSYKILSYSKHSPLYFVSGLFPKQPVIWTSSELFSNVNGDMYIWRSVAFAWKSTKVLLNDIDCLKKSFHLSIVLHWIGSENNFIIVWFCYSLYHSSLFNAYTLDSRI